MCPFSVHDGEVKKQNQPMAPQKKRNDLFRQGISEEFPIANERRRRESERRVRERGRRQESNAAIKSENQNNQKGAIL